MTYDERNTVEENRKWKHRWNKQAVGIKEILRRKHPKNEEEIHWEFEINLNVV